MKDETQKILAYLECEGEMLRLRSSMLKLNTSRSEALQRAIDNLSDAISQTNVESHECAGFYYLFLGCAYRERDEHQNAVLNLQSAANELWESQINKSLARWLLGLSYSNLREFPKARNELQEALRLLKSTSRTNSYRAYKANRSQQAIEQDINYTLRRLFNTPLFRETSSNPAARRNRFPIQDPPANEEDGSSVSVNLPFTITNENYSNINNSFPIPISAASPKPNKASEEQPIETRKFYENRTDDDYLSILSMPILNQEFAANNIGKADNEGDATNGYAEIKTIFLDEKEYTVHSLRDSKEVKITSSRRWEWGKISGNSMNHIHNKPPIMDGDYVLVALQNDANENDIVLVKFEESASAQYRWIVKRYRKDKGLLQSETTETGKEYEDIDVSATNAKIVGVAYAVAKPKIAIGKKNKT